MLVTPINQSEQALSQYTVDLISFLTMPLTIDETATCEQLINLFKLNQERECIVLVDAFKRPLGLFMKNSVFMKLSRRYSSDLYYEKSVSILIDDSPLILDINTSPEQVMQAALNRQQKQRYDCVVIVDVNHVLKGVLTLTNILEISNQLQQHSKYEQTLLMEKVNGYIHHIADQMMTNTNLQNKQILNMKQDSKQLNKIAVDVIELSERSNILALNATIEAAKAKENGLAFNVVATEVRELSQKTKASVSHIQHVIQTILQLIEKNEATSTSSVTVTRQSETVINKAEEVFKSIFTALAQHQNELSTISQQAKKVTGLTNKTKQELDVLSRYLK